MHVQGSEESSSERNLFIDTKKLSESLPFPDFMDSLKTRPVEVMVRHMISFVANLSGKILQGSIGLACSLLISERMRSNDPSTCSMVPYIIRPRFLHLNNSLELSAGNNYMDDDAVCDFAELKAGKVGQMVDTVYGDMTASA
jgi:hypothetical protein